MMQVEEVKQVWLVGIGGIGMSALARYFHREGKPVAGYDRRPSGVTEALESEGISVFFDSSPDCIAPVFRAPRHTLVIYTPAVEQEQEQLVWFRKQGFEVLKRAQVLGMLSARKEAVCIAGTHGKTTISTLTAHLFRQSKVGCTAFLGGISKNYRSNFLWDEQSPYVVLEADEFDRSFLWLSPSLALISAVDADHLDIYGSHQEVEKAFAAFARRVKPNGVLVMKQGLRVQDGGKTDVKVLTYALEDASADYYAVELSLEDGLYCFSLQTPGGLIPDLKMGIPGLLNVENAIGAMALALNAGVEAEEIRAALSDFKGIARRFDLHVSSPGLVYIDDYAHHPEEIRATLSSVRALYPGFRLCGVFQPHLYTRTRDFAEGFAESLALLDELFLMDIYPARELPLPGVSAQTIGELIREVPVGYVGPEDLPEVLQPGAQPTVVLTMGAGDIDRLVPRIAKHLSRLVSLK